MGEAVTGEDGATEYVLRIAGKRQVTLPEEMLTALNLQRDDELRVVVHTPSDIRLVPYARVRKDLLTPEIEAILQQRRQEIAEGGELTPLSELMRASTRKESKDLGSMRPAARRQGDENASAR